MNNLINDICTLIGITVLGVILAFILISIIAKLIKAWRKRRQNRTAVMDGLIVLTNSVNQLSKQIEYQRADLQSMFHDEPTKEEMEQALKQPINTPPIKAAPILSDGDKLCVCGHPKSQHQTMSNGSLGFCVVCQAGCGVFREQPPEPWRAAAVVPDPNPTIT